MNTVHLFCSFICTYLFVCHNYIRYILGKSQYFFTNCSFIYIKSECLKHGRQANFLGNKQIVIFLHYIHATLLLIKKIPWPYVTLV